MQYYSQFPSEGQNTKEVEEAGGGKQEKQVGGAGHH
jgi:hypothetical protein